MTRQRLPFILLLLLSLLLTACSWPLLSLPDVAAKGVLDVEIDYTGDFYHQVFNYSRDAANVKHYVLVLPQEMASRGDPNWIFGSLDVQADGSLQMTSDRQEYNWVLPYIHEAPSGYYKAELDPGTYAVAVAFITGPVSREQVGAGDDAILWVGITGGGASSEYQFLTIEPDETSATTFTLTDRNGWACPWLYVFDGQTFERRTEILRNIRGPQHEQTETTTIGRVKVVDGSVVVKVAEEKDEVSYIDSLALVTNAGIIAAEADPATTTKLASDDGDYLVLKQGDSVKLHFPAPAGLADGDPVSVVVNGYYVPTDAGS